MSNDDIPGTDWDRVFHRIDVNASLSPVDEPRLSREESIAELIEIAYRASEGAQRAMSWPRPDDCERMWGFPRYAVAVCSLSPDLDAIQRAVGDGASRWLAEQEES